MRAKLAAFCVSILASAGVCAAQTPAGTPNPNGQADYSKVYCSGFRERPKSSRRYSSYFGRTVELQDYFLARRLCICQPRRAAGRQARRCFFHRAAGQGSDATSGSTGRTKLTKTNGYCVSRRRTDSDRQRSGRRLPPQKFSFRAITCSAETWRGRLSSARRLRIRMLRNSTSSLPRAASRWDAS